MNRRFILYKTKKPDNPSDNPSDNADMSNEKEIKYCSP
jgi:hypothetical protein